MLTAGLLFFCVALFAPSATAQTQILGGEPLATSAPTFPDAGTHPAPPGSLWGSNAAPYPTNAWWNNFVLDQGDQAVVTLPYEVKARADGLSICLPEKVVDGGGKFILMAYVDNWVVGATEGLGQHSLTSYDNLMATLSWESGFETPLVRGAPYITFFFEGKTPSLTTIHAILSINGGMEDSATGTRFEVELNNGQTWVLYTSETVTFSRGGGGLVASAPFTGSLRVACVGEGNTADDLDAYASSIPVAGVVEGFANGDEATYTFTWQTMGEGEPFMMALPHHMDIISGVETTTHVINSLRGDMVGVVGTTWTLTEPMTPIEFDAPSPIDADKMDALRAALQADINGNEADSADTYFGGKQMARLARLSLMADQIGEADLAQQFRDKVKPTLQNWLDGTAANPLLYDGMWGGLVSTNGLTDPGADFGLGYYQDHHFHFGYWAYTAAVLAAADPAWGTQYEDQMLQLIRDIIEPSGGDQYYPFSRSKDWFTGHSWANGVITAFADSKNQESTSEGVNAYYAVYLYGLSMGNDHLRDLGRLALATEIRSAHKYWQITSADDIYPSPFADTKVVGILWSTKVDYATWFGANIEFIHCIQMLPFTPISEELLRPEWIQEEYPILEQAFNTATEEWRGYIIMAHAVIDKEAAWTEAQALNVFDNGNCRSNTYYWIATRP